jgi:type IV secretion system protein TrbL
MQFNALTLTLQHFITALSGGYSRIQGAASALLGILIGIEVVLLGLWTALGGGDNVVGIFKRILHIGVWVWIVQSYPTLCKALCESLVKAGLLAGGGTGDVTLLMDPSRLAGYGLDATEPLSHKLADLGMTDLSDLVVFGFGYLAILACFLIMAINVFLAVLEYYVFAALVGIFLPFGLLAPTKFLAEKAIGAVVASAVKLMVLGLVTSIIDPVLSSIRFAGPEITLNELWSVFLTVCALMFLCWKAPSLAGSLLGGSPHLGVDHLVQAASTPVAAAIALGSPGERAAAGVSATRAAASVGPVASVAIAASSLAAASAPGRAAGAGDPGRSASPGPETANPSAGADVSLVLSAMGKEAPAPATPPMPNGTKPTTERTKTA